MNNWDVNRKVPTKPTMTVIVGASDIPEYAVGEVVKFSLGMLNIAESSIVRNEGRHDSNPTFHLLETESLEGVDITEAINCLEDHILNTKIDDWLDHDFNIWVDDDLEVNVLYGVYEGPGCTINTWFVTE